MTIRLVRPSVADLPACRAALEREWSPDNVRGADAAREQLAQMDSDPAGFVASLDDPEAKGARIMLPDGSHVQRLPGIMRWIFREDAFCGSIGLRWRADGDPTLPSYVLGHIGYAVVPWERGRGAATNALRLLLPEARARRLPYVELTTQPDNVPSQKVITANGGRHVATFEKAAAYGGGETLLWRIDL